MLKRLLDTPLKWLVLLVPFVFVVGCDDDDLENMPSFYLEMGNSYNTLDKGMELHLENSGLNYYVFSQPIIPPWNVTNVELVRVDSGDLALRFYFDSEGQRILYRNSVTNNGRMIITVVDGEAIGARQIDGAMEGGVFYTFTEIPEEKLKELVPKMQETIRKMNRLKVENGI